MFKFEPPRPTATKEMILAAAQVVAEKIDADAETIAEHYRPGMDGYELAKELDKWAYWDTSREDMEALDEVDWLVSAAVAKAEKEWVAEHNIQPPVPVGYRVQCDVRKEVGTITGVCTRGAARYLIKPDGQDDATAGERRWLCKFEQVTPV